MKSKLIAYGIFYTLVFGAGFSGAAIVGANNFTHGVVTGLVVGVTTAFFKKPAISGLISLQGKIFGKS